MPGQLVIEPVDPPFADDAQELLHWAVNPGMAATIWGLQLASLSQNLLQVSTTLPLLLPPPQPCVVAANRPSPAAKRPNTEIILFDIRVSLVRENPGPQSTMAAPARALRATYSLTRRSSQPGAGQPPALS